MITNSQTQTHIYTYSNHNISICYNPDSSIYFNVVSCGTFENYCGKITKEELDSVSSDINHLTLDKLYHIITNAFESKPNYNIAFKYENTTKSNLLSIIFTVCFESFYDIEYIVQLNEKVLTNDKLYTIKLSEMELKFQSKINELEKQLDMLANEEIIFGHHKTKFNTLLKFSPKIKTLDLTNTDEYLWYGNYIDFNKLKYIKKIIMNNNNFEYEKTTLDDFKISDGDKINMYLSLNYATRFSGNLSYKTESSNSTYLNHQNFLFNIFDSVQISLPSVEELEINYKIPYQLSSLYLRSLPNLSKITFINYANNELISFELIHNLKNLVELNYLVCKNIKDLDKIKNYCDEKKIKLIIN